MIQSTTNLVLQFDRIILKILATHLHNWTLLFLDNVGIKDPKTIYINNEKLVLGIRSYIIKYIQNLDKVIANLE